MDKELALGWLLGDALGFQLKSNEARLVGKTAAKALVAAKKAADSLKGNAAAKRSAARKAAHNNQERAAAIDDRLAAIDGDRDAALAKL